MPSYQSLAAFSALLQASLARSSGTGWEVQPGFNLNWILSDPTTVTFTFVIPDNTWMGLMLGS